MSTIDAGTTVPTALTLTGTTDGTLDFATGGTIRMTLTSGGNLNFAGTAQRITGDMSNATIGNRLAIQTSTTDGATRLSVIPNGTATTTAINLASSSDPGNASLLLLSAESTVTRITSTLTGTGTYLPLLISTGGSERVRIDTTGALGLSGANYGTAGQVLTSNGSGSAPSWQTVGGSKLQSQTFTSSGTFTVPTGITSVWVTMTGGGGSGGAGISFDGGPSGAAGAFTIKRAVSVTAGASITVTIGGGGAGVAAGIAATTAGGRGGTTSFGSVSVTGGYGGRFGTGYMGTGGANGGVGFGPNPARPPGSVGGTPGLAGSYISGNVATWGGAGGLFGDGTDGVTNGASSNAGANTGAGSGGTGNTGSTTSATGNGGSGMVIVEWLG
jgi:hypothetical protein